MFEDLKEILVAKLKVSPDLVTPEATKNDLELDSLAVIELAILIEQTLSIIVSEEELLEAGTLDDIVRLLEMQGSGSA
jgi:acyl carrier protein